MGAAGAGRLREVEPAAWDGLLDGLGCRDAYFRRGFFDAACLVEPGAATLLHLEGAGGHVVFACIVREVPAGHGARDIVTPYGYGGPLALGADPPVARFHELYEEWCAAEGVVTTFVRFHPLHENWRYAAPRARLERLANTASWPLRPDADLLGEMHAKHRREIRRGVEAGLETVVRPAPEELGDFVALYEDTMRRRDADAFYFFSAAYWDALASGLRERLLVVDGRFEGELVAGALFLATPPWLHYHLGAMRDPGGSLGATKVVLYEAARWAREQGYAELHLGSGLGGREDSLWRFKQRFSPSAGREFWIGKLVHDEARYRELAGEAPTDGYFPAYRAAAAVEARR